ncbi:MAG TPA: glycoside hydrolase family 16 protein [Sedimentisphaerales bacterium]|nr:glycoside hydrolase family 16 protein [Sedimentisphaerales bacterium]
MRRAIVLFLSVSAVLGLTGCNENLKTAKTITPEKAGYVLTFADEFDGDKLDETKWTMGYPGWTEPESAPMAYVIDANQCELRDGINYMKEEKRKCKNLNGVEKEYASALIQTADTFMQCFGWYEIRCKMPKFLGAFPAFWLFPKGNIEPPSGEIDVFEHLSRWGEYTSWNMHWGDYADKHREILAQKYLVPGINSEYHTYACDWEPGKVSFYVDGQMYSSFEGKEVPSVPMYMIVNGGIEGWGWKVAEDSAFPDALAVDYIRVYQRKDLLKK